MYLHYICSEGMQLPGGEAVAWKLQDRRSYLNCNMLVMQRCSSRGDMNVNKCNTNNPMKHLRTRHAKVTKLKRSNGKMDKTLESSFSEIRKLEIQSNDSPIHSPALPAPVGHWKCWIPLHGWTSGATVLVPMSKINLWNRCLQNGLIIFQAS